jgi:coiled-coil and C2 domain-containing protein 1
MLKHFSFQVNVVRGINLHVPSGYTAKNLETNVVVEFPYPTDATQEARTRHATGSMNAEYPDAVHRFTIKRADTKLARAMGRKELKLSVYHKAGFLRADRLLGVAKLKLAALEHSANIHESADVYEDERKKKAEGKVEVKVRIKEALGVNKASELTAQKWLVIDRFEDTVMFC